MGNFELSLNEEINLLIESNLTPTELFILRLLYLAKDGDKKYLSNYLSNISNGSEILSAVLESLIDKKVINNTFKVPKKGDILKLDSIPFNKNFLKKYIRESNEIGKEFLEAYPYFISINGKMVSIKNFTKGGFFSPEEFCLFYGKTIKNSGATHERIMEALSFAKERNLIHYTILEFLASRKWEEIEYIRNSGEVNNYQNSELI